MIGRYCTANAYAELDARYNLRTEGGHLIYVRVSGRRYATPEILQKLLRGELFGTRGTRAESQRLPLALTRETSQFVPQSHPGEQRTG